MKTAFVHDSSFVLFNGNYYTKDGLDKEVFDNYTKFFGDVTVFARYENVNKNNEIYIKKENLIDNVEFKCIKSFKEAPSLLKNELKNYNFVILRVHSFVSTVAYFYVKKYNIKYLAESVACAWDCLWYHSIKGKILALPMYILTKKIIKSANYVTYVSKFLKKRYSPSNKALYTICSDVRLNNYKKNNYNVSNVNENLKICTIANVDVKYKGHAYVIKALSKLKKIGKNFDYYLVGGGSGNRLKKMIGRMGLEKNVHFVGPIPHLQIFDYLKNIDIYVQPSNAESHGRVILEAQSLGIPVIGSSTGGIPEIVNFDFVFKRKSSKALADKLTLMLKGNNLYRQSEWSFTNSKKFMPNELYSIRNKFYSDILDDLKERNE